MLKPLLAVKWCYHEVKVRGSIQRGIILPMQDVARNSSARHQW